MWSISLLFSFLVVCAMQKCKGCDVTDGIGAAIGGVLSVLVIFVLNLTRDSTIIDWIIQGSMVAISLKIWQKHYKTIIKRRQKH